MSAVEPGSTQTLLDVRTAMNEMVGELRRLVGESKPAVASRVEQFDLSQQLGIGISQPGTDADRAVEVINPYPVSVELHASLDGAGTLLAIVPPYTGMVRSFKKVRELSLRAIGGAPSFQPTLAVLIRYDRPLQPIAYSVANDVTLVSEVVGPGPLAEGSSVGTFPTDHPYARGKLANAVSIAAGATLNYDLVTAGYEALRVEVRMTAAVVGDLSAAVRAYEDDGVTLEGGGGNGAFAMSNANGAPQYAGTGVIYSGGVAGEIFSFPFLLGIDKVQIRAVNNNAAGQTLTVVYSLQK